MSTKEIAKKISDLSGSRNPREVFSDWVTCMAISIANMGGCQDAIWKLREDTYMSLMKHYKDNGKELGDLMGQIILELEKDPRDVLGEIFMSNELGSSKQGQFFTPFGMSELTARLTIDDLKPDQNGVISMTEPSCGSGGMIIAAYTELVIKGSLPQSKLHVVCQDIAWMCVYMCYVQLSLLGIHAIVVQGDTLSDPYVPGKTPKERVLLTPRARGLII